MLLTSRRALYFVFERLMEKLNFDYSLKNVLVPDNTTYNLKKFEKFESILKRMHWEAYFLLNPDKKKQEQRLLMVLNHGITHYFKLSQD